AFQRTHVVGRDRALESLERQLADRLGVDQVAGGGVDALTDENLPGGRLRAQAEGEIGDGPDGAVVQAALEADGADGRVALGDAEAGMQLVAALAPPPRTMRAASWGEKKRLSRPTRSSSATWRATRSSRVAFHRASSAVWAWTVSWSALIRSIERTRATSACWSTGLVR